ncbi:Versicolorin B synthase [Rhypophila decipiens]|uniref:Versicolorin B synthase n=1 Tax=Rhypophila decipiens TaxID=261697 RepID=A0AAN7B9I0_9PEZI|nr:Versicolorin B synthase [Rhypophila decipiens]
MASPKQLDEPYDYIIVGGGTAGLVLANRLSENIKVRVIVIEAGADRTADPLVLTPGVVPALYGKDEYDWNFPSVPQLNLNNRRIFQPRGKMLGGSSALNFMMLVHPNKHIIDGWAELGNHGWDYNSLSPYFRKFPTSHLPSEAAKNVVGLAYHSDAVTSGDGPVQVSFSEGYGPTNKAWFDTFAELGLDLKTDDPRDGEAVGAFQNPATIDPATKTRSFAASAYLTPEVLKRPNLVVMTETLVSKVVFDTSSEDEEPVAVGVEVVTKEGEKKAIKAAREVILCAGALQSPQILELSGIGDRKILDKYGIPVVAGNPNVGEGAQDHPIVLQSFEVADGVQSGDMLRDPALMQALMEIYQTTRDGPLGQSNISSAYIPMVNDLGVLPMDDRKTLFESHSSSLTSKSHGIQRAALEQEKGTPAFQYILFQTQANIPENPTCLTDFLVPVSEGNFISPGPKIEWDPKFNDNPLDEEILVGGVQFVEKIIAPGTALGKLLKPGGRRLPGMVADSHEKARDIIRQRLVSLFHVSGTCAMLPRENGGVVDSRLRVYGVKGLRVVDASVFPLEPSGNIQSVVYAVAERAADLIKADLDM